MRRHDILPAREEMGVLRRDAARERTVNHEVGVAALAVVAACLVLWGLVSGRLERWDVSAPIAFVVAGLLTSNGPIAVIHVNLHSSTVRSLAEVTLALVLFADASRVNARQLHSAAAVPLRLLCVGLPLTIAAGAATAALLFGSNGLWVAALIGAIVAPTDAGSRGPHHGGRTHTSQCSSPAECRERAQRRYSDAIRESLPGRCDHQRVDLRCAERRIGPRSIFSAVRA